MAPTVVAAAARFVDVALSKKGPFSLSYADHQSLKRLIRDHVLSLLHSYPSLSPSSAPFPFSTPAGPAVPNLLTFTGPLPLPSSTIPIHLTLWLPPNYPCSPPLVYVSSPSGGPLSHPLIDPSTGAAMTPYLLTWEYPRSSLADLVRNFVKIFAFWPPCIGGALALPATQARPSSSAPSKREAVDRLAMLLQYDVAVHTAASTAETKILAQINLDLKGRATAAAQVVRNLEKDLAEVGKRVAQMEETAEETAKWLGRMDTSAFPDDKPEDVLEFVNEEEELDMESRTAEEAIDEAMRVLEMALERKVVSASEYLKQVRTLAREQFSHRATIEMLLTRDFC